jgi:hypothetical protein
VCGIAQSGARYFYCDALGLMPSDPCVHAHSSGEPDRCARFLSEKPADCCEVVTLPALPDGARLASPSVVPAALVAVVPIGGSTELPATPALRASNRFFERWRPPPRSSSEIRAQLMVFLT